MRFKIKSFDLSTMTIDLEPLDPASIEIEKTEVIKKPAKQKKDVGCISEFLHDESCFVSFANCTKSAQKAWLDAYPLDFIIIEVKRARAWIESNKHKAPRDFQRFFNSWLSRAFETYRKGLSSKVITTAEKNELHLKDLWAKNERGEL